MTLRRLLPLALAAACTPPGDDAPADTDAVDTSRYADDALWACLPGAPGDVCARDLTATDLAVDGTASTVTPERAVDAPFDCFYVYPTVVLSGGGQDTDFSEPGAKLDPLLSQAAPFTAVCDVYAPYYRQAALDAFGTPGALEGAYADVEEAFRQFLAHRSGGRPFAILGHSQGTYHLSRLLADVIEADDALHDRLVVAVLLGGTIQVPEGEVVGGTFAKTPLCTTPGQRGCVVAWDTYAAGDAPSEGDLFGFADPGFVNACTDPTVLAGNPGRLSGSWFATKAYGPAFTNFNNPYDEVETPFVRVADRFDAACVTRDGATYLEVTDAPPEGDARVTPPWRNTLQESAGFGMHGLDYNMSIEDLLDVVGAIAP